MRQAGQPLSRKIRAAPHRRFIRVPPIRKRLGSPILAAIIEPMTPLTPPPRNRPILRAVIEVAFIVFLFYSNLLMGEFTGVNGQGKSLAFALGDILTPANFLIAMVSACIGYVIFEFLRKKC
jgi:hypothetical protein